MSAEPEDIAGVEADKPDTVQVRLDTALEEAILDWGRAPDYAEGYPKARAWEKIRTLLARIAVQEQKIIHQMGLVAESQRKFEHAEDQAKAYSNSISRMAGDLTAVRRQLAAAQERIEKLSGLMRRCLDLDRDHSAENSAHCPGCALRAEIETALAAPQREEGE